MSKNSNLRLDAILATFLFAVMLSVAFLRVEIAYQAKSK